MSTASLILGPSLGTTAFVWSETSARLPAHLRIIDYELPGHGQRAAAEHNLSISAVADQVIAAADSLGIECFHYAGISLCGAVGLDLALRYPHRLSSVAVICSAAKIGQSGPWHERAQLVRAEGTQALLQGSANRWFAPTFVDEAPRTAARLLQDLAAVDDNSYALLCETLADFDVRARLPEIAVPALVVSGEHDGVIPPQTGQALAQSITGAKYREIPGAGHLAPAERPAMVARLLADFIRENS